jgi:uncharacterized protein
LQENILQNRMNALAALQKVDLEIAVLLKSAENVPKEVAELEKQLGSQKSAVAAEHAKLDDLERQRRTLDSTIVEERDKVRKWEGRLAEQRSTREYSALAREIDIAKKGQQTMVEETQSLEKQALLQRELLKQKDAEFVTAAQGLNERMAFLKNKLAEVGAAVARIDDRRATAAKEVESTLLKKYEVVRKKRSPAFVAVTGQGTCSGCRMNIPPRLFHQLLQSKGIDTCPSCQRLIFAEDSGPVADGEA